MAAQFLHGCVVIKIPAEIEPFDLFEDSIGKVRFEMTVENHADADCRLQRRRHGNSASECRISLCGNR